MHKLTLEGVQASIRAQYQQLGLYSVTGMGTELGQGLHYVLARQGKCLRAAWLLAAGQTFAVQPQVLLHLATALELIHTFSLVQDDLPCMDDDGLRRGQVACHRRFSAGVALLVSDALFNEAYAVLASVPGMTAQQCCIALQMTAKAVGQRGLLLGQYRDLVGPPQLSEADLLSLYHLKTGLLFVLAIDLAALAANQLGSLLHQEMRACMQAYGLAYQIADDYQDDWEHLGARAQRHHYICLFGSVQAQRLLQAKRAYLVEKMQGALYGTVLADFYQHEAAPLLMIAADQHQVG
jgi:geranylgeranyl pyrophosphate synthase